MFFFKFSFSELFFSVVLTPADLWYHAWFPRYRHLTLFVTQEQEQQQQEQELGILGVGLYLNGQKSYFTSSALVSGKGWLASISKMLLTKTLGLKVFKMAIGRCVDQKYCINIIDL